MKTKYDIIVIGAGSGGLGVGIGMAKFGFDVLMIEKDKSNFGGECLNSGCIPSKALVHVADIIEKARQSKEYGLEVSGKPDIQKVLKYVHGKQQSIRDHESAEYLKKEEGLDVEIGTATFTGKNEVEANGKRFTAKKILVATGSKPRELKVKGVEHVKTFTNENLFHIDFIPENFLIVGGGPIGMEMGQCFARMGSKVTVMDMANRIMNKELPEVSKLVQSRLEKNGMEFLLEHELVEFNSNNTAILKDKTGRTKEVKCDAVLVGIGRDITYNSLNLAKAGVKLNDKGQPLIDDYLRAKGNKNIVFAGDAARNLLFSHAAELHTTILLTNFFTPWPFKKKWNTDDFSWVTFTDPEVATFGLSLEEIKSRGISFQTIDFKFDKDDRAIASDYEYGRLWLFLKENKINPRNGKVLGGTYVGPNAGEMIQELIMAKQQGLGAGAMFNKVYPYPTQGRVTKIALVEEFSGGLTPLIKKMFKFLYH
jgi:pyruvate/2-oxoglutarate dehydrogenase complex dihydrolipoamide dehydrogenase (E3) component